MCLAPKIPFGADGACGAHPGPLLHRTLGGDGGSAYEDSTHPWMCSGLQELGYQVAFSKPPFSSVSQAKLLLAPWGTSYGDSHEGLEWRAAAGFEMTSGIVKHNCTLAILLLMAHHFSTSVPVEPPGARTANRG